MTGLLTEKGLALLKNNGKIMTQALEANEKALNEGKLYMSSKTASGQPRKRSNYVQYLRGYMSALKDVADGKMLTPWEPSPRPVQAAANVDVKAIVDAAVKAALAAVKASK